MFLPTILKVYILIHLLGVSIILLDEFCFGNNKGKKKKDVL